VLGRLFDANHYQHDPTYEHQSAQDRRYRSSLPGVNVGLNAPGIDGLLVACITTPLIRKRHDAEKNESDTDLYYWFSFHKNSPRFHHKNARKGLPSKTGQSWKEFTLRA
jgi:hypothetical protein